MNYDPDNRHLRAADSSDVDLGDRFMGREYAEYESGCRFELAVCDASTPDFTQQRDLVNILGGSSDV